MHTLEVKNLLLTVIQALCKAANGFAPKFWRSRESAQRSNKHVHLFVIEVIWIRKAF